MDIQTQIDHLETRCHVLQLALFAVLNAMPPQLKLQERISAALETAELEALDGNLNSAPSMACPDLYALLTGRHFD